MACEQALPQFGKVVDARETRESIRRSLACSRAAPLAIGGGYING